MENKNTSISENVLVHSPAKKSKLFYVILFALATVASAVILLVAFNGFMRVWKTYSIVMTAVFFVLTIVAALVYCASSSKMYLKNDELRVKSKLLTRKFKLSDIEKVKGARFEDQDISTVKITTADKTYKYTYTGISKEDAMRIRKIK